MAMMPEDVGNRQAISVSPNMWVVTELEPSNVTNAITVSYDNALDCSSASTFVLPLSTGTEVTLVVMFVLFS